VPSTSTERDDDDGDDVEGSCADDSLRSPLERRLSMDSVPSGSGDGDAGSKSKRPKKSPAPPPSDIAKVLSEFLASTQHEAEDVRKAVSIHYIIMAQH